MKKRNTILGRADRIIKKDYNLNFQFNTMGLSEQIWFSTICKILDQRLEKIKKDLEEELKNKIVF